MLQRQIWQEGHTVQLTTHKNKPPGREREGTRWWEADGHRRLCRERVPGKGSEKWREADRHRPLQTATQTVVMPTPPLILG